LAQRSSRKRRGQRQRERAADPAPKASRSGGYAASREKDEAARRALKPLAAGERPTAVTVGAIVATVLFVANLVALLIAIIKGAAEPPEAVRSAAVIVILGVVAWGMWHARYWGVLGMHTILALTIVLASLALLLGSYSVLEGIGLVAILVPAGVLFWFLVKAMARIQMPDRPGARS
jgi:Ca2+/Na+ antiporter